MAYPIRQGDGDPPEWQPPDYAKPLDEEEDWTPPSYAKAVEEPKIKKSIFSKVKEALTPKPFNPTSTPPLAKSDIGDPSSEERIKNANELQDPGQGDYFAKHPSSLAEPKHEIGQDIKSFAQSVIPTVKSAINTATTAPKFITNPADRFANEVLDPPRENSDPRAAFGAGVVQAGAKMLTPVNVALSAIGAGETALIKSIGAGAKELIPALMNVQKARQAISIPIAVHGAYGVAAPNKTWMERLESIPELAGGLLGTFGGKFAHIADEEMPKGLGSGSSEIPYRMNEPPPPSPINQEPPIKQEVKPNFVNPFEKSVAPTKETIDKLQSDNPPIIDDQGGTDFIPEENQRGYTGESSPKLEKFLQDVRQQVSEPTQEVSESPLPIRSPNLDPNRYPIPNSETPVSKGKSIEDLQFELAQNKFNMGKSLPGGVRPKEWTPPEYAKETEEPKTELAKEIKFSHNNPELGGRQYDVEGGSTISEQEALKRGYTLPESPTAEEAANQPRLSGKDLREKALAERAGKTWTPPNYAKPIEESKFKPVKRTISEEQLTKGFGGSGHPENADFTSKVLSAAGKGTPGLSVEPVSAVGKNTANLNAQHIVFRDPEGNPVVVAKIVQDSKGKNLVMDLAADKTKGLLTGRGTTAVAKKLLELGATEPAGTMSPDAENFLKRMKGYVKSSKFTDEVAPKESSEPSFSRTEGGGTRMDIGDKKDMIRVFRNTYSGSIPHVATKELIQNAIDATSDMGAEGKVDVKTSAKTGVVEVTDNGPGLTRDMIDTVYSNLSSSGKRAEGSNKIGEMGVGKTTYMVAGKHVAVDTVAREPSDGKLYRHTFEGTPEELMDEFHPKQTEVPEGTPTGTKVTMQSPEGSKYEGLKQYLTNFGKYSKNPVPISIEHEGVYSFEKAEKKDVPVRTEISGRDLGGEEVPGTKYNLTIPDDAQWIESDRIPLILNNRGMFQGVDQHYIGDKAEVPDRIVVEIDPNVMATDDKYPLTAPTRERLKDDIRSKIGAYIDKNLVNAQKEKRTNEIKRVYDKLENSKDKHIVYDGGERYTPEELTRIKRSPVMNKIGDIIKNVVDELSTVINIGTKKVTRTGFIFDKLRGVNLKLPGNDDVILMVNPFSEMQPGMTPKQTAQGIVHIIIHEFTHVNERSEGSNYTAHLASVYEKFDLERQLNARNKILSALTEGKYFKTEGAELSPEIQDLLQEYTESRRRYATSNDLLLREAGSSFVKEEGPRGVSKDDKPDGEGTSAAAVDKLFSAMNDAREGMEEQETINKQERAKRFSDFVSVKQGGAAGAAKSLGKLRGEIEKVNPGERLNLTQADTDSLFTAIKKAKITPGEQARGYTAMFKLMNGESTPQRNELKILDDVFGGGFSDKIIEMHGGLGVTGLKIAKLANTMKSLENAMSLAAPLRHGIGLAYRKEFYPAFRDMFKFFANKDFYQEGMKAIVERPNYLLKREAGLFTAKPGSLLGAEEEFLNSYAGNIPIARNMVGSSQRGYVGFLNKLRDDTSENMLRRMEELGYKKSTIVGQGDKAIEIPTKETKAIMRFVNIFSGRGELPFGLEKMTNELNVLLWSPRMLASRIQMFTNPKLYMDLPKGMRLEGLKSALAVAALGTIIDTSLAYAGAKISYNILSTDFGKSRFGTRLMDPWGGLQQFVVGFARFLAGKTDNSQPTSRLEIAGRFLANKESPAASLAHTLLTAKKFTGKSDDPLTAGNFTDQYGNKTNIQSEIGKRFLPIFVQDVKDLSDSDKEWSEDIGLNAIMGLGSLTGMAQNYPEKKGGLQMRKMKTNVLKPVQ